MWTLIYILIFLQTTNIFVAGGCGGYYTSMNGSFTSENYPSDYPHHSRCNYTITVPEGYSITLTFTDFRIEADYDFVWVKENGATLFNGTGSKNITSIKSWGNSLFVYFTSDGTITESGFSATYYTNNAIGCGGYFTSMNGYFTSENYPSDYPHHSRCNYTIMVPEGYSITLTFTDFRIEADYDFVWVKENGATLFNGTGSKNITSIKSWGNSLFVYFTSDGTITESGFSATYYTNKASGCGGYFTSMNGYFTSENYPSDYPHHSRCNYTIMVPEGYSITLTFTDFRIEADYDFVWVKENGVTLFSGTGSKNITSIKSWGNSLFVYFTSDGTITESGFSATYYTNNASGCGGNFTSMNGYFTSENYPSDYPHHSRCNYTIMVPEGYSITLTFTDFRIEADYDFVWVKENGVTLFSGTGSKNITSIKSWGNSLFVYFTSDGTITESGFSATYYTNNASGCGGNFTSMNGYFTSENYPSDYPHHSRCNYTIMVPEGYSITLTFTDFRIEADYDFVWVKENGVTLFSGTGSKNITSIKSWGNSLFVYFTSDGTITESGFSATYYTNKASGCGGNFTSMNGYFTSENYPSDYPHHSRCNYTIMVPEGYSITLTFTDFRIEADYDFVWVKENGVTLFSGTGSKNITSIKSWGNSLFVYFTSDGTITESGFSATYYTNKASGCGGYFTSMNGYFTSENYPSAYPHNSRCSYTIMVPEGYSITLTFTDFRIEAGYDFVWVKEYVMTLFNETGSKEHITAINSSGNSLYVYFTSDGSMAKSGFSATYYTNRVVNDDWSSWSNWNRCTVSCGGSISTRSRNCSNPVPSNGCSPCFGDSVQSRICNTNRCPGGCGGYYTSMNGSFTSENYPSDYPHNSRCSYTITVPEGYSITLTFTDFQIEAGYDFVWVKDYVMTLFNETGSKEHITAINSSGNSLYVYFTSDGSMAKSGFSATYYTNRVVNDDWSSWSNWNRCTVSCGGSISTRSRNCSNPVPSNGCSLCFGDSVQSRICNTNRCPVNGNWSTWSIWENCDVTCGIGIQHRRRACDNPCPVLGGFICTGNDLQTQNCSTSPCPVVVDINSQLHSSGVVAGVAVACIICTFVLCLIVHFTIRRLRQNKGRQEDRSAIIDGGVNCDEFEVSYANPGYIIPDNSQDDVCESTERPERNAEQNLYGNLKY